MNRKLQSSQTDSNRNAILEEVLESPHRPNFSIVPESRQDQLQILSRFCIQPPRKEETRGMRGEIRESYYWKPKSSTFGGNRHNEGDEVLEIEEKEVTQTL